MLSTAYNRASYTSLSVSQASPSTSLGRSSSIHVEGGIRDYGGSHRRMSGSTAVEELVRERPPIFSSKGELDRGVTVALGILSWLLIMAAFPFSLFFCLRVVKEFERVIFRLGSLLSAKAVGPGLFFILPCIDTFQKMDLRTMTYDVPPQEILSSDSVTVSVDAVIYFRLVDPTAAVTNVNDAFYATKLLAQTTLRNVLGVKSLAQMLSDRDGICALAKAELHNCTLNWGVHVERVEMKDIRLPQEMTRSMAAEAEAERLARAHAIFAQGEVKAAAALRATAELMEANPMIMRLRQLQSARSMASDDHPSTIVFPIDFPIHLFLGDGWADRYRYDTE